MICLSKNEQGADLLASYLAKTLDAPRMAELAATPECADCRGLAACGNGWMNSRSPKSRPGFDARLYARIAAEESRRPWWYRLAVASHRPGGRDRSGGGDPVRARPGEPGCYQAGQQDRHRTSGAGRGRPGFADSARKVTHAVPVDRYRDDRRWRVHLPAQNDIVQQKQLRQQKLKQQKAQHRRWCRCRRPRSSVSCKCRPRIGNARYRSSLRNAASRWKQRLNRLQQLSPEQAQRLQDVYPAFVNLRPVRRLAVRPRSRNCVS